MRFETRAFHPSEYQMEIPEEDFDRDTVNMTAAELRAFGQAKQLEQARLKQLTDNAIRWRAHQTGDKQSVPIFFFLLEYDI